MDTVVKKFITEVIKKFTYLEDEYGYKLVEGKVENQDYYPDSQAVVKYIGPFISVEVYWYFAGANIGVVFVERRDGVIPEKKIFFGESSGFARAINLYTLAKLLNKWDDRIFLLEDDIDNVTVSKIEKREKVINQNMNEIIEGLAYAVKKIANQIITGDTSIFKDVMNYQRELIDKQYL